MFDATSRYASIPTTTVEIPDGEGGTREVRYVRRRFVPRPEGMITLAIHVLTQSDRLDTIAYRYLGDPTQYWRVCDANTALDPVDLTAEEEVGRTLVIPVPQA